MRVGDIFCRVEGADRLAPRDRCDEPGGGRSMQLEASRMGNAMDEEMVDAFLDGQWESLDPEPWTSAKCVLTMEWEGQIIGAATGNCEAGVAHLSELMVAAGERNSGLG